MSEKAVSYEGRGSDLGSQNETKEVTGGTWKRETALSERELAEYRRTNDLESLGKAVDHLKPIVSYFVRTLCPPPLFKDTDREDMAIGCNIELATKILPEFDPKKKDFYSFATIRIKQYVLHHNRQGRDISQPGRPRDEAKTLYDKVVRLFHQSYARDPLNNSELAQFVGCTEADLDEVLKQSALKPIMRSLQDEQYGEGFGSRERVEDYIIDPVDHFASAEDRIMIKEAIERCLNPMEKKIVRELHYEGKAQDEIALELGISQMQVSRLYRQALAKLRLPLQDLEPVSTRASQTPKEPALEKRRGKEGTKFAFMVAAQKKLNEAKAGRIGSKKEMGNEDESLEEPK